MVAIKPLLSLFCFFFSLQGFTAPQPSKTISPPQPLQRLRVILDWHPSVEFAGLIAAKELGLFKKSGIDLQLKYGSLNSIPDITAGKYDVGLQSAHDVIRYVSKGYPLKAFAAKYQKTPLSIMVTKKSGIKSIKQLKGKTLGMFIKHDYNFYKVLLAQHGLKPTDVKFKKLKSINHKYLISSLEKKHIDALVGWEFNWTLAFPMQGLELKVFPGHQNGFHYYGIVYYGNKSFVAANRKLLAQFLKVSFIGWKKVFKKPNYYTKLIIDKYYPKNKFIKNSKNLTYKQQLLELKLRQRYLFEGVGVNRIGMMTDFAWKHSLDISKKHKLLESKKNISSKDFYDTKVLQLIYGAKL